MTKALENLTLTTQVMANRIGTMQGSGQSPNSSGINTGVASSTGAMINEDCYYCGGKHRRTRCADFNAACAEGKIHLSRENRICLGRSGHGDEPLWMTRAQLQKVTVENALQEAARKQQERQNASAVHTSSLRLGELYDSDATTDTDDEADSAVVEVRAARPAGQSGGSGSSQLRGKAAREDRLPAVKTVRPGEYANTSLFGRPASAANQDFSGPAMAQARERNNQSRPAEDAEMLDAGARVTKQN